MTAVLVSGGTGLVGRYIVEDLLAHGYRVRIGSRNQPEQGLFSKHVEHAPLDLDPDTDNSEAFDDVYHFVHAAFHHVPGRYRGGEGNDPEAFRHLNLCGSVRLFETARTAGVRRCVFLSSRAIYDGALKNTPLAEDAVLKPSSFYGEIKLLAEQALAELCGPGFTGTSLRVTGVYGGLRPNKWDGLFTDYLAGRPVSARAGSEVHGRDVGQAVRLMLESHCALISGQSFNVTDLVTDTHEILSVLSDATNCRHPLPERADFNDVAVMDTSRIGALGWQPGGRTLLDETIRSLAAELARDGVKA